VLDAVHDLLYFIFYCLLLEPHNIGFQTVLKFCCLCIKVLSHWWSTKFQAGCYFDIVLHIFL